MQTKDKLDTTKEALTRELEHAIDERCYSILSGINNIINNTHVNTSNFISMTYLLEALEDIYDATNVVMEISVAASVLNKLNIDQKKISIVDE